MEEVGRPVRELDPGLAEALAVPRCLVELGLGGRVDPGAEPVGADAVGELAGLAVLLLDERDGDGERGGQCEAAGYVEAWAQGEPRQGAHEGGDRGPRPRGPDQGGAHDRDRNLAPAVGGHPQQQDPDHCVGHAGLVLVEQETGEVLLVGGGRDAGEEEHCVAQQADGHAAHERGVVDASRDDDQERRQNEREAQGPLGPPEKREVRAAQREQHEIAKHRHGGPGEPLQARE